MARTFDGANDLIVTSAGATTGTTFGTFAVIMQRNSTAYNSLVFLHTSTPTGIYGMLIEDNASGNQLELATAANSRFSTFTVVNADGWVLVAAGKATGSATPRFHKYVYSSNSWTHENGGGTLANASGTVNNVRFGEWEGIDDFGGDLAVAAMWKRNLADGEVELLAHSLTAWHASAPTALWTFDQSATTQNVLDLTGGGANQSSLTGTSVSSSSVPVFSYGHPIWVAQSGGATVTGAAVASLGGLVGTAAGTRTVLGTAPAPLGALAATAATLRTVSGTASSATSLTATAAGTRTVAGTASASLGGLAATAAGVTTRTGSAAANLGSLAATATGTVTVLGGGIATTALSATAVGGRTVLATAASITSLTATIVGTRTVTGTTPAPLGALVATAAGAVTVPALAAAPLSGLNGTALTVRTVFAGAQAVLGPLTGTGSDGGAATITGSGSAAVGGLTGTVAGRRVVLAVATTGLGQLTAAALAADRFIHPPDIGTITRPSTGLILRPSTGTVTRPGTGLILRPDIDIIEQP